MIKMEADIKKAMKDLTRLEKKMVPKARHRALGVASRQAFREASRYAAKSFKMTQKKVRQKKIVYIRRPKFNDPWMAVWFNEYKDSMTVKKGYTISDANSASAQPATGKSVTGQPFIINPLNTKKSHNIFVKRDARKRRAKNKWKSSAVQMLYYTRSVNNAERMASIIERRASRRFLKEFEIDMNKRIQKVF